MKRISLIIVTTLALASLVPLKSQTPSSSATIRQTPRATTPLRRIQVNVQTITALPRGKNYVVDLTQRGVNYDFDPQGGRIDLSRITVRTAQGEVAIGSFLKTTFLKGQLEGFKYTSQAFSLRTRPSGTLQTSGTKSLIKCDWSYDICTCTGEDECDELIWDRACGDIRFCATNPITNQVVCSCKLRTR